MVYKRLVLLTGIVGLLMASSLPASAQFADFFCDTFTIGCRPPPPPPPPPAPMAEEPASMPKTHKTHMAKPKVKKTDAAPAAPAAK